MGISSVRRERGLWSRSLALVAVLAVGTACGGSGDRSAANDGAAANDPIAAEAPTAADGEQQVVPSQLRDVEGPKAAAERVLNQGGQRPPAPPAPDLGIGRPQAPPNTVSLDALHQQGRTHVLR